MTPLPTLDIIRSLDDIRSAWMVRPWVYPHEKSESELRTGHAPSAEGDSEVPRRSHSPPKGGTKKSVKQI